MRLCFNWDHPKPDANRRFVLCSDLDVMGRCVDYEETVTIFCVRDFFESKRLSQSILNDKDRSRRVNGSFVGQQVRKKSKAVKSPELKAAITSALGKRMAPVVENGNCTATGGEVAVKRQTIASNGS
ncbi:hypothetical protein BBJ28_00010696 [Nothophytophthora sp. Chile5]|nr:hypothetical protein BBJ28_00010696 [Nothophytophthora sp. Chile5]